LFMKAMTMLYLYHRVVTWFRMENCPEFPKKEGRTYICTELAYVFDYIYTENCTAELRKISNYYLDILQ